MADDSNITQPEAPRLKADRTWYSSLFTQLLAPLVATRYIWLAIEDINPFDFLDKKKPEIKVGEPAPTPYKEPSFGRYASRNFAAFGMGATVLSIMGVYSKNTLHDIKSVYAEAVGYELDKKPQDVTYSDIFFKSQNEALQITRKTFIDRSIARAATAATFFVPWQKLRPKAYQSTKPNYEANANAGLGAVGIYLYGEGFMRKPSFFDIEQKVISSKINHNDINPYGIVIPQDVQSLLTLHRKHINKHYSPPLGSSPEGQNDFKMASRIADLINTTYDNIPPVDKKSFTIGKLNYLIGFGLLEKFPESMAFIELANKSADMKEVKQAAEAIRNRQDPQAVFQQYGIDMNQLAANTAKPIEFSENTQEKFTKNIQHKTLKDFAEKSPGAGLNI